MNTPASTSPRKPWADWLIVAVFAGLLWLPTVDLLTGIDPTRSLGENRLLAPKPRLTQFDFIGVRHYVSAVELYFNDHFGFRKRLIRWFQQWRERLYHDHGSVQKGAMEGQHGWLFYSGLGTYEHYLGTARFTPAELRTWQKVLEKRRDWLAARGIKYYFVIPPDKHNVYPEELPAWLQAAAPTHREIMLDQFLQYMREHSTVNIIDLRPALLAAKATAPTYLQNDTHWNTFGAFAGSQEIIRTLSRDFPDLPALRLENFNWTNQPETGGDLSRILGAEPPEKNAFIFTPKPPLTAPVIHLVTNLALHHWDVRNTNAFSVLAETTGSLQETAVVFHDSFLGVRYRPFLGSCFKQVLFVWENREFNTRIIAEYHPNIVINEMLERFFETQDPAELLAKDAVP
ncbi:MAG TPA: alginate O-acetyltransferase [Verrucomicrobiae bacterium]